MEDTNPASVMEESPRARRTVSETQYINFGISVQKMPNGWEESPKLRRAIQMTSESHEEFEFTMSHAVMKDDTHEPAMEVAPADELFFRGQLLPLQHDPRLQLVHSLSGIKEERIEEIASFESIVEEEIAMKLAYEEAFPFAQTDAEGFHADYAYEEKPSVVHPDNAEGSRVHERNSAVKFHGSDAAIDASKNDSRSSSFRSQQSSYWGSGEKDSRDSSSSSRCSNGSSQDAYLHGTERKALHLNKAMVNGNVDAHAKSAAAVSAAADKAQHHQQDGNPPPPPAPKVKKWSWKALLTGLKKASKVWIDDRGHGHGHTASGGDVHKQKKSVFGCTTASQAHGGAAEMEKGGYERQTGKSSSGDMKRARQPASSSRGRGSAHEEHGGGQMYGKYYASNGGWRGYNSFYEGSHGGRPGKEKARLGIIAWNARESWQRWVKRPLHGKPSHAHKHASLHEDAQSLGVKAKSLSSTPLSKSPVRRADNVCRDAEYDAAPAKYTKVGFAASCPASMRSSPHHSGVLAVVNKAPPASSLHDLHTAIQGAIAHCKQSQTANPV